MRAPRSRGMVSGSLCVYSSLLSAHLVVSHGYGHPYSEQAFIYRKRRRRICRNILVDPSRRVVDSLLQRSLHVRKRLGRASKLHASADVVPPAVAVLAAFARQANLERDPIARLDVRDARSHGDDGAARFVAQRQRLAHEDITIAEVAKVVQVGAAEASGLDGDLDLVRRGSWETALFL